jgi:hypothetical protein
MAAITKKRKYILAASPLKPLGQFYPNFSRRVLGGLYDTALKKDIHPWTI